MTTELDGRLAEALSQIDTALDTRGLTPGLNRRESRSLCLSLLDDADLNGREDLADEILVRLARLGGLERRVRVRWGRRLLRRGWRDADLPSLAWLALEHQDVRSTVVLDAVERARLSEAMSQIEEGATPFARAARKFAPGL